MAPKGTPPAAVDYLHKQVVSVLEEPSLRETLRAQAAEGVGMSPVELAKLIREDAASWEQILRAAKITAE